MATSLAEQLKRLTVPQTSILKRDKYRASLLFDSKEAAGIRRETIYQIGVEGLEELITKNSLFQQFRHTLFGATSKDFERSVHDADANEKLNKNIRRFLLLLSPYFLINCSHKALEWLINRYMINEYNREDLLMLIMPYHESNIFVRVLQLLKFKDENDPWYFLKALQKPGVHLPKEALLNRAASSTAFLKFVGNYIRALLKVHDKPIILTVSFNFYCTVFTGALEFSDKVEEDQISQMLPMILKGLNSDIADFCAASYVITARLVAKVSLSEKLLNKLAEKVSIMKCSGLHTEAVLVLLVLAQSQKDFRRFPPTAVENLSSKEFIPKVLQELNNSGSFIYPFLQQLLTSCTDYGLRNNKAEVLKFVSDTLDAVKIDENCFPGVLHSILDGTNSNMKYTDEAKKWLSEILQTLERQYPTAFDKEIYNILTQPQGGKRKRILRKVLKKIFHRRGKFEIFEKLYQSNPQLRQEAIKNLKDMYDLFKDTDKEIVKSSLIDRLSDDNVSVVKQTLNILDGVTIFTADELKVPLLLLTWKCKMDQKNYQVLSKQVLKLLCNGNPPNDWLVFLTIFPYLLPKTSKDLEETKVIFETNFRNHPILSQISVEDCKEPDAFIKNLLLKLEEAKSFDFIKEFLMVLKTQPKQLNNYMYKYLTGIILAHLLPESPISVSQLVLEILVENMKSAKSKSKKGKDLLEGYLSVLKKNRFPVIGYLKCFEMVVNKTKIDDIPTDFTSESVERRFFTNLTEILCRDSENYSEIFNKFMDKLFGDKHKEKVEFLLNLTSSRQIPLCNENILSYLQKYLQSIENQSNQLLDFNSLTIPCILSIIHDDNEDIRKLALQICETLIIDEKKSNYGLLVDGLLKQKEEIVLDKEQLPLIIFNIIAPENTKGKKNVRDLNLIRNQLFAAISNESYPNYLKASLLKVVALINTPEMLENLSKVALDNFNALVSVNSESDSGALFEITNSKAEILKLVIERIDGQSVKKLSQSSNAFNLIDNCLKRHNGYLIIDDQKLNISVLVLDQFDNSFFAALPKDMAKVILDKIVELTTLATNPEILPAAMRVFKHIDLDCDLILEQLHKMRDAKSPKIDSIRKRRSVIPTVDILDTLDWRKGVCVLEFIQDKKKLHNGHILLPLLFELLKKCLDFDEQAAVEYPKQLILSSILHCCQISTNVSQNVFELPLIVQCIRASQNPQTHHHALLLLAEVASTIDKPTDVLQHMIPIFTFVGSSILRHDDAYSFQIMAKIIDTIIPIITQDNSMLNISKILRNFVDSILDVPEHRRQPLYNQLLNRINPEENLYLFLLLIFESHVVHHSQNQKQKDKSTSSNKRLEIAADLCRGFPPGIVIGTCIKLIKYLKDLPDEKEEAMEVDEMDIDDMPTFNVDKYTAKQFRHYKFTLVTFIAGLLGSTEFVSQVAALSDDELLGLEGLFKDMIIHILTYIQRTSKVAEKSAHTPQSHYWKTMLHHSYDILDSINALLTSQMFLLVTRGLMVHNLPMVRRRSLELFNTKLQFHQSYFTDCPTSELYALIQPITSIIETVNQQPDNEQEQIIQIALLSLKLLVKHLACEDPEKFVKILQFITDLIRSGKAQKNVLASAVLCLAELCVNLRAHSISSLPDFMPALIKILKQQINVDSNGVLLISILTAIQKIFDSLSLFLSPYMQKLLIELSLLMSKFNVDENDKQPIVHKLLNIKQKIGLIPARILIPATEDCYNNLIKKRCFNAIGSLMDILAENLTNLKNNEVSAHLQDLTAFFLNALQFRCDVEATLEEANLVEGHIVKAFTILILKLSESAFRPLYYKLFDWAARNDVSERLITFYSLSNGIAERLKGLFVLFAGHFLNNAAQILDALNLIKNEKAYFEDDQKNILLLENVLKTLNNVFLHDSQKFINKDRFEVLMQPLVDQLENVLGGFDKLISRNNDILTPCLVHFAVATADDALWKQMNYQILLKMRHDKPIVRLIALKCLTEIVKKLGEDFLPLLPETIPFLAELLEDEDENVEKSCQKAVQEMEKVLGEPLQKYF